MSEFNHVLLVDREYRNTPYEKAYRAGKVRFDPEWHQEQATAATTANDWYAANFHFALLTKNDPERASFQDDLHSSFQKLKLKYEQENRNLEPHLATVVKEALKFPVVNESPILPIPAEFATGKLTENPKAYGVKRLQALLAGGDDSDSHYLGMLEGKVGIPVESNSGRESTFVLEIKKEGKFAVLTDSEGKYLTARGEEIVLTDTLKPRSHWVIRRPLKADMNPNDGWFSLESADDPGRFLRHYSMIAYAHKKSELTLDQAKLFPADASWKFVDAQ